TLFIGTEIKGARRWLNFAGIGLQPSEFLKPAFVVLAAWLFAESAKRPEMPANILAILLLLATVTPLVMQPDVGQTTLITVVWAALFF
ncbi:FtsW/RodA/SpoVE family cell cycle protein, partial [Acinetobacter baumannii]|uniref:FtsW/RodA/SpoVE family cell cycle protein n=1 Tax=Acinetobacter baumannii TaxID=470 RepID=UPI0013D2007E